MARTRMIQRWRHNMDVCDDADYVDALATLSEASVRRSFNPYTGIDWESPEFAATEIAADMHPRRQRTSRH
jgi:hypothetical protein